MSFPTSFAQKVSSVVSEADGYTKSEPGAVATGTNTQLGFVLNALRRLQFYVERMPRSLPLPVLYLSTHAEHCLAP